MSRRPSRDIERIIRDGTAIDRAIVAARRRVIQRHRQLGVPLAYTALAGAIFVTYLGGFLLAVFHPQKRTLHDLLAGSEVRRTR